MVTLFPDQVTWENDIRAAYRGGAKSVLGVAPTGFGKTVVFAHMAASALARGNSTGIFAHRAELVDQIGRALKREGVPHGYIAPGFPANPLAPVQVCSIPTMARRIERLTRNPFGFWVIDEAHHATAGTAAHAIVQAHSGIHGLGVTATPERLSGEPLSIAFDQMVVGPSTADLIRMGRLSPYRLFAPFRPDMTGIDKRGGDFAKDQTASLMDRPTITGDAVAHYLRLARGKRALAFCVSVAHAEHTAEQFRTAGVPSASLDGSMDRTTRRNTLAAFERGEILVLTSCDLVSEGFDVPAIECIIMLRPTASLALFLQMVGRGLRVFPGKLFAIILDHAGNTQPKESGGRGHGFPDDPRVWTLGGGRPKKGDLNATRASPTVTCGKCWGTFRPAPCCPYCGHDRDIKGREIASIDGDLVEVDPDLVREAHRREQEALNRRVQQTRGLPALAKLAIELGKDEHTAAGWIHRLHKARGNPNTEFTNAVKAIKKAKAEANGG